MNKTFDQAVDGYRMSRQYRALAVSTKKSRDIYLPLLLTHLSGYQLSEITRPMVLAIRDTYWDTSGKCHATIAALKATMSWAYDQGWIKDNIAAFIGDMPPHQPIRRWTPDEIAHFMEAAPHHLMAVMHVALYTGQRRSDLCRADWSDYNGLTIFFRQQKTGKELHVPVHPRLRSFLDSCPRKAWADRHPMLLNKYGAPWEPESMRVAVKRHCKKVGLEEKMLHGIRKTTASILAEIGCTPSQIMSITGHTSLKEVQRYTLEAEQKTMATEAMGKWHS